MSAQLIDGKALAAGILERVRLQRTALGKRPLRLVSVRFSNVEDSAVQLEMFAESNNKFFLKVNDAQLEFVNESGKITKAILKQGGRTTDAMKIK
jgi:hypothetical protein